MRPFFFIDGGAAISPAYVKKAPPNKNGNKLVDFGENILQDGGL